MAVSNNWWLTTCSIVDIIGATVVPSNVYGPGSNSMPIYIDNSLCFGEEDRLIECLYDPHTADCDHSKDVGVKCVPQGDYIHYSVLLCLCLLCNGC